MTYRVELTARAGRNLKRIFRHINAESSPLASVWFNELEAAILSLDEHPERSPATP
jgi:plasmid stabilization system protein ParE